MRWCRLCILPDTRPNLSIGNDGICNACHNHGEKTSIAWSTREAAFSGLVDEIRARARGYDCVIPVSGGKDSTWQVVKCLEYGLRPLAVTWRPPGRTVIGQENLDNLRRLGVDHLDYSINPRTEATLMRRAFERYGSTAVPMHLAIFAIPLSIAVRFGIPLVVWGENSAVEYGSDDVTTKGVKLDRNWLRKFGVTYGTTASDWVDDTLTAKDLAAYYGPDPDELEALGVRAVFLGHFFPWDPETSFAVAQSHGFRRAEQGARTGLYDYADIDDDFISIHHWMKWYKFGFTRLFDNLSLEIRNGRLSRDQAVGAVRARGEQRPSADITKLCAFVERSEDWFFSTAERFRNHSIWKQAQGTWVIPEFLIPDWNWT